MIVKQKRDAILSYPLALLYAMALTGSVAISSFAQTKAPSNLFELDTTSIVTEVSLKFSFVNKGDFLVQSTGAVGRTPAIYFGKVKVTAGQRYTYLIKGKANSYNGIVIYVVSKNGNIVWPGSKVEGDVAKNSFIIPEGIDEISLGLVFMYPMNGDYALIKDIALVDGDVKVTDWKPLVGNQYSKFIKAGKNNATNLLSEADFSFKTEKGVDHSFITYEDSDYLIVRSTGVDNGTPAIYFATYKVEPGQTYSYIVRGKSTKNCTLSLYVSSPGGNIVWPGSRVENGFGKSTFQIPPNVHVITLGMAFAYATNNEFLLIEDVNLFQGDVDPWNWETADEGGLQSIISSQVPTRQSWRLPLIIASMLLPVLLYFMYKRQKSPVTSSI